MTFRLATHADIPQMMPLFEAASQGLRNIGVNQWQNGYPQRSLIESDVESGVSFVLLDEGVIIGTAVISFGGEPTYDHIEGAWLTTEAEFVVIHRLTIRPDRRGARLAERLFAEAERMCRERGVRTMRIDTHEGNLPMQRAVERYGFQRCGVIYLDNGDPRLAYEKPLDE